MVIILPFPLKLYLLPTAECRFPWAPNHIDPPIQLPSNPRCCNLVSKFPGTEIKISQLAYFDEKLRPIRLSCNDLLERNDRKERDIKIYDIIFRQTWSFLTTASVILCDKCIICICWSPPFWKSDEKKLGIHMDRATVCLNWKLGKVEWTRNLANIAIVSVNLYWTNFWKN